MYPRPRIAPMLPTSHDIEIRNGGYYVSARIGLNVAAQAFRRGRALGQGVQSVTAGGYARDEVRLIL